MIATVGSGLAWLRRLFSRSDWAIRLLGLSRRTDPDAPGLILIQIDGLSRPQLQAALDRGRMPFLSGLLAREGYRLDSFYSGLPSSTPAVQGELFFGVPTAVPAFSFLDGETGRVALMYDPGAAATVETRLAARGKALLAGGSVYADIYTGGAAEAHFCPAALGWGSLLRAAAPSRVAVFMLSHAFSFVRAGVLAMIELALALKDAVWGMAEGRSPPAELRFVPARVAVCVLLRDFVTIGASIDAARGMPIIHVNYLGYDEQAHRRGPSSAFAHWALKGIDDALGRLWRAAHRSRRRHFQVWIYSDHGQEATRPYQEIHGRSLRRAVSDFHARLERHRTEKDERATPPGQAGSEAFERARYLGGGWFRYLLPRMGLGQDTRSPTAPTITAKGPLALVYWPTPLTDADRAFLAPALLAETRVPLILTTDGPGRVAAWTAAGRFSLPDQASEILGSGHPFVGSVAQDLIALVHHADAGDFVLSGWDPAGPAVSFAMENGGHAGPGAQETHGFALVPAGALPDADRHGPLRPSTLRDAAFDVLKSRRTATGYLPARSPAGTFRIMTYNVHSCIGTDGRLSPERVAQAIAREAPDIVALQELDAGRARTGGTDQAELLAHLLEMQVHFHPAIHVAAERYGDAVLTALPMRLVKAGALPGISRREPRGALWVAVTVGDVEVQIVNTHLGLGGAERVRQVEALLGPDWLGHPDCTGPAILCGDFNARPVSPAYRRIRAMSWHDAQILADRPPRPTFPSRLPAVRIDHIFVGPGLRVTDIAVPRSHLSRIASDHLPLTATLELVSCL